MEPPKQNNRHHNIIFKRGDKYLVSTLPYEQRKSKIVSQSNEQTINESINESINKSITESIEKNQRASKRIKEQQK